MIQTVMRVNLGKATVSAKALDSENELRARVAECKSGTVLEGEEDVARSFLLLEARSVRGEGLVRYGLLVTQPSVIPELACHADPSMCWLAFDSVLALLSMAEPKCVRTQRLNGLFRDLLFAEEDNIIVIHELGATCFDQRGEPLWDLAGHDMLEDYHFTETELVLVFQDGQVCRRQISALGQAE